MPNDPLYGTPDHDLLQIGDGSEPDAIFGDEGNDTIQGRANNDILVGDGGHDRIWGGDGNDRVDGLDGDDRLFGGRGDDFFDAGWGDDTVYGGGGDDGVNLGYGSDLVYGGDGNDGVFAYNAILLGFDTIYGGEGNDNATFLDLATGHFDGGEGDDRLVLYWHAPGNNHFGHTHVDITGAAPIAKNYNPSGDVVVEVTFESVEILDIQTGFGNDTVKSGAGGDYLFVGQGDNTVDSGAGDDLVIYHTGGANTIDGGLGTDTLNVGNMSHLVLNFDASTPTITDGFGSVLSGFERFVVYGGSFADTVILGDDNDRFEGKFGNDTAHGGTGDDTLNGDRDNDVLHGEAGEDRIFGGSGADTLHGGDDDDRLNGGNNDDEIHGGAGRDNIVGAAGADLMFGGAERDNFRFNSAPEADRIGDFVTGEDRLYFSQAILNGSPAPGRMTAADLSSGVPVGSAAQFLYDVTATGGNLYWDQDGNGAAAAILLVTLTDGAALSGTDIYIF